MPRANTSGKQPSTWIIWLLLILPLLGLTILGSSLVWSEWNRLRLNPISTEHDLLLDRITQRFSQQQAHLAQLTRLLQQSLALEQALDRERGFDPAPLRQLFLRISQTSPLIDQLRWIDADGQERIRLNTADGPRLVPDEKLQNKAHRDYFQHAISSTSSEVQFSPLDLNLEHGRIAMPPTPTLRSQVHTGLDDGLLPGVLVINFSLRPFFTELEQLQSDQRDVWLVNEDGYWLIHPEPWREWGFIYQQPELVLAQEFPELWQQLLQQPSQPGLHLQDRLWSYTRIDPEPGVRQPDTRHWYLLLSTPPALLARQQQAFMLLLAAAGLLVLLLGGSLLWRLAHGEHQRRVLLEQLEQEGRRLSQRNRELDTALQRQQQLQDELVETRKLSSLGMMVAGVAHELNTPCGAVLMTLSTLHRELQQLQDDVSEERLTRKQMALYLQHSDKGLALAGQNIRKATSLIRSFKRLALERSLEAPARFALQDCIQDLTTSLQPRLKAHAIRLRQQLPDCTLYNHPGILSQVLQNLIDNALEHAFTTGRQGHIWLDGELEGEGEDTQQLKLQIRDDGRGISETILPCLFDPFVTSGRSQGHTGLGLHLVHQWVTRILHGSIQVDSSTEHGSCFTLLLPLDIRDRQTSP